MAVRKTPVVGNLLVAFLMLAGIVGSDTRATSPPLILAVHPYLTVAELQQRFAPLAEYLGAALARPVEVRVGRDYAEHIAYVGADHADLAFLGPAPYVKMVARHGHKPLLARLEINGDPTFRGHIIVRSDSPLRTLADLKGKRFAFGDRESTMSHQVPEYMLRQAGVPLRALAHHEFLGSHKNVVLAVLAGQFDAGAVKEDVLAEHAARGLRSLAPTAPFSEHLFVARANLPAELIETIRRAMYGLRDAPNAAAVMRGINPGMTGLVPVDDRDYNNLRDVLKTLGK